MLIKGFKLQLLATFLDAQRLTIINSHKEMGEVVKCE
jgi:hypothetical protein